MMPIFYSLEGAQQPGFGNSRHNGVKTFIDFQLNRLYGWRGIIVNRPSKNLSGMYQVTWLGLIDVYLKSDSGFWRRLAVHLSIR